MSPPLIINLEKKNITIKITVRRFFLFLLMSWKPNLLCISFSSPLLLSDTLHNWRYLPPHTWEVPAAPAGDKLRSILCFCFFYCIFLVDSFFLIRGGERRLRQKTSWQAEQNKYIRQYKNIYTQILWGVSGRTFGEYLSPGGLLPAAVSVALSFSLLGFTSVPSLLSSSFTFTSADGPASASFSASFPPAAAPACSSSLTFSGVPGSFVPSAARSAKVNYTKTNGIWRKTNGWNSRLTPVIMWLTRGRESVYDTILLQF